MTSMQMGVQRAGRAKPTMGAMIMRTTRARQARQRGLGRGFGQGSSPLQQAAIAASQALANAISQYGPNSPQAAAAWQQQTAANNALSQGIGSGLVAQQIAGTAAPATTSSTAYIIAGVIGVLVVGGLVYFATE